MPSKCCVPSCNSIKKGTKSAEVSFHEFPSDFTVRSKWIKAISSAGDTRKECWNPTDYSVVCSKHFLLQDYRTTSPHRILKKDAVPTIFGQYPPYVQPKQAPKQRVLEREESLGGPATKVPRLGVLNSAAGQGSATTNKGNLDETNNSDSLIECSKENCPSRFKEAAVQVDVQTKIILKDIHLAFERHRKKVARLEKQLREYKLKAQKLQEQLEEYRFYPQVRPVYESAEEGDHRAIFLLDQINNFSKKKPEWSESTIQNCLIWQVTSPKGYRHVRSSDFIKAPSESTLERYVNRSTDTSSEATSSGANQRPKVT